MMMLESSPEVGLPEVGCPPADVLVILLLRNQPNCHGDNDAVRSSEGIPEGHHVRTLLREKRIRGFVINGRLSTPERILFCLSGILWDKCSFISL